LTLSLATPEEVRQHANRILTESMLSGQMELVREVMGEAHRNARRRRRFETRSERVGTQEVQTLLNVARFETEAGRMPRTAANLEYPMVKNLCRLRAWNDVES